MKQTMFFFSKSKIQNLSSEKSKNNLFWKLNYKSISKIKTKED
jgi:hypothetical protein